MEEKITDEELLKSIEKEFNFDRATQWEAIVRLLKFMINYKELDAKRAFSDI